MKPSAFNLDAERRALKPAARLDISAWVEAHRSLSQLHHADPGPMDLDVTPHVRGVLAACADRQTREIWLMWSTQVAKTETMIGATLWTVCEEPRPGLWVLPIEDDIASFVLPPAGRLAASIDECPPARERLQKITEHAIQFEGCRLDFAWAGSPAKLASRSIGHLVLDEVDKFPRFSGGEADPISLAVERMRWFPDAKLLGASTPTTTEGQIYRNWLRTDQRRFHCPCPLCGKFFAWEFHEHVMWPKDERDPDVIRDRKLAWLQCPHCDRPIADDAPTKSRMMLGGVWCPTGGDVVGGQVRGARTDAKRKGFHLNALYSPRLSWSDVAAKFLEAKDDPAELLNFTNSWLGWPWIEKAEDLKEERLLALKTSLQPGTVPNDAVVLTAGVDRKKDQLHFVIRAWGSGERSWLISEGSVEHEEVLEELLFHTPWRSEDGREFSVRLACLDSGWQTDDVYAFCTRHPDRARPVKGHREGRLAGGVPMVPTRVRRDWIGRTTWELTLWNLNVTYFQDKLAALINAPLGGPRSFALHAAPSADYIKHMLNEQKLLVRDKKRRTVSYVWKEIGPQHLRDAEVYALAAADMLGVWSLRDEAAAARASGAAPEPDGPRPTKKTKRSGRFGGGFSFRNRRRS